MNEAGGLFSSPTKRKQASPMRQLTAKLDATIAAIEQNTNKIEKLQKEVIKYKQLANNLIKEINLLTNTTSPEGAPNGQSSVAKSR